MAGEGLGAVSSAAAAARNLSLLRSRGAFLRSTATGAARLCSGSGTGDGGEGPGHVSRLQLQQHSAPGSEEEEAAEEEEAEEEAAEEAAAEEEAAEEEERTLEGWEDGTPPPHRDFKERGVVH